MANTNYPDILITRRQHERFTLIARDITNGETGLSLRATGLLCHLLGKPRDWKTWSRQLAQSWGCSRTVILAILKELRHAGYAKLDYRRDDQGRLSGKFWRISDLPEFKPDGPQVTDKARKAAPGTDGLLSRTSEKSEHRERSPLQNTDFWTKQREKTEEEGEVPPTPSLLRPLFTAYAAAYEDQYGRRYKPTRQDALTGLSVDRVDPAVWNQLIDWVFSNLRERRDDKGTIVNLHSFNAHRRWAYLATHLVDVSREWRAAWRIEGRRVPNLDGSHSTPSRRTRAEVEAAFAEADKNREAHYKSSRVNAVPEKQLSPPQVSIAERLRNRRCSRPQ